MSLAHVTFDHHKHITYQKRVLHADILQKSCFFSDSNISSAELQPYDYMTILGINYRTVLVFDLNGSRLTDDVR